MGRQKGSKNKHSSAIPMYSDFSTQERIITLANLIVDRILDDQRKDKAILKKITKGGYVRPRST